MWWGKGQDKPKDPPKEPEPNTTAKDAANAAPAVAGFDPDKLPEREKLPKKLQKIIDKSDKEENFYDEIVEG